MNTQDADRQIRPGNLPASRAGIEHAIPLAEYRERLDRVLAAIAEEDIDVLVATAPESIYYLTGYQTTLQASFPALAVWRDGRVEFLTRLVDYTNLFPVLDAGVITSWTTYTDDQDPLRVLTEILDQSPVPARKVAGELRSFSLNVHAYTSLAAHFGTALIDGTHIVERLRLLKSASELQHHRDAGAIVSHGMMAACAAVAVGHRDTDIASAASSGLIEAGGEWAVMPPLIKVGPRAGRAHTTWHDEVVLPGQPVTIELSGVSWRYHTVLSRSVLIEPAPEQKRIAAAIAEANAAGIAAVRAGTPGSGVARANTQVLEKFGFGDLAKSRFGYTLGIGFPPNHIQERGMNLVATEDRPLQAGMVFHMLTLLLRPNEFGIAHSASVAVTESGCEILTHDGHTGPIVHG